MRGNKQWLLVDCSLARGLLLAHRDICCGCAKEVGIGAKRTSPPVYEYTAYVTLSSSGSSPWKLANWNATPQQISFAVLSTGGSSWSIDVIYEDPTGVYPSPRSSAPTPFTILTGSSNQTIEVGPGSTSGIAVIAGYRLNLNVPSSAGASVTLVSLQAGI